MRGYRIGYIAAMLIIQEKLANGYETFPVNEPVQLFRMLDIGRIDVVVTSRVIGELTISKLGLKGISCAKEPLKIIPNYHFLSEANADIAIQISAVLKDMDRSGRIDEITEATLARLFSGENE